MIPDDTKPNDGAPTIDSLLKGNNWEERLAEARAKREKVLAAKNGTPLPEANTGSETEIEVQPATEDTSTPPPMRAVRPQRSQPAPVRPRLRLRLRWVFLGAVVAACAFVFWAR